MEPQGQAAKEVTRELPPGDRCPVDLDRVLTAPSRAIGRTLQDLRPLSVPMRTVTVFRGDESEVATHEVQSPHYRDTLVWERIAEVWRSPEFMDLADYLWERGAMKRTFHGPDPDKDAWARWTFGDLVHTPLTIVLEWTAREA